MVVVVWIVRFVRFCFEFSAGVVVVVFVVWLAGLFFFRGDLCSTALFGVGFRGWFAWRGSQICLVCHSCSGLFLSISGIFVPSYSNIEPVRLFS